MKTLLAVLAVVALTGGIAKAEDKGTEFKFGGEVMERFTYDNNPGFLSSGAINENNWLQRNQFHVNAVSSDRLQAYINLLNYSVWGASAAVPTNGSPYGTGTNGAVTANGGTKDSNSFQINEAWLWWKVSDMFSIRSGRQSIDYGDGLVFSKNDWLANPYNVDALMGRFSWDFLDLDVGGGKFLDAGPVATGGNTTDVETLFYGVYAGFKNLPDFLKKADVFVLQINSDANGAAAGAYAPFAPSMSGASAWNLTNYGLHLKGDFSIVDYRIDGVWQSGKQKTGAPDVTFAGSMYDVEVGVNFPEFMKGRVFANYHMDTGNDSTSADKNNRYQPLFYDQHTYAGLMDIFGFGNLTDIRVGLTLQPMEDTSVGVEANMFSRTTDQDAASTVSAAFNGMFAVPTTGVAPGTGTDKALGTEIDLWAKHNYGHGFSMLGQAGFMTLGSYYKPAGASVGSAYQLVAQAKYNF